MRMMLAQGILMTAMLGVAGPLVCDSGCVARAEEARPVPHVGTSWLMRELRLLTENYHRRHGIEGFSPQLEQRQARENRNPQPASERREVREKRNPDVEREQRRELRRGDFWRPGELYNLMGRPNDHFPR